MSACSTFTFGAVENFNMADVKNLIPLKPRMLNLTLTERCDIACSMCVTESHPQRKDPDLPEAVAISLIQEAATIEGFTGICFIGGEPFLRQATMVTLSIEGKRLGFDISAVTNCSWASTPERAREILSALKDGGLARISVSADVFHQKFIPLQNIDNAVGAAEALGVRCNLHCVVTNDSWGIKHLREKLSNFGYLDRVSEFKCLPVGRARQLQLGSNWQEDLPTGRCDLVISTISVKASGDVYACCGVGGFTPPLKFGNALERSLSEILSEALKSPLIIALGIHGPALLARLLIKEGWTSSGYVDVCHLCNAILRDPKLSAIAEKELAKLADLLLAEYHVLSQV